MTLAYRASTYFISRPVYPATPVPAASRWRAAPTPVDEPAPDRHAQGLTRSVSGTVVSAMRPHRRDWREGRVRSRAAWTSTSRPSTSSIRDTVRTFARERVAPVAEELDRESRFPVELVGEMAELGLMGIPIPEEHGGAGGDTVAYAIAIEELTRIDSSVAITVAAHTSLGTMPIFLFGSEEQKAALAARPRLRPAGSRRSGSPSRTRARTRARRARPPTLRDGCWVVNGSKMFITNAGTELTLGRDDHGAHRRGRDLEPRRRERHARLRDLGAAPQARLEGVRHARAHVRRLRRFPRATCSARAAQGFHQFLEILDGGRISVAAMGVGLAQGAYDLAYGVREGATAVREADRDVPGGRVQARGHGGRDRGRPPARATGPRG